MKVLLKMTSSPESDDPILRVLPADYRYVPLKSGGNATLMYHQQLDETGTDIVTEILKASLDPDGQVRQVTLSRPGSAFRLEFSPGQEWQTTVSGPSGQIEAQTHTHTVEGRFTQEEGVLHLVYEIFLDHSSQGLMEINLKISGKGE